MQIQLCPIYNLRLKPSSWTSIKHNQTSTNDSECSGTDWSSTSPKRAHVTPLFVSLHWLPVAARIQFKTLMLAYRTTTGSAPTYFHSLLRIYIPSRSLNLLVSDASWYHHREAQNHSPEHSLSPFLAGGMIFPSPSGMLDPCQFSSNNWKLISFNSTWLHIKKKKKNLNFHFFKIFIFLFIFSLLPLLACTYLNNAWDLVLWHFLCMFASSRLIALCVPQL